MTLCLGIDATRSVVGAKERNRIITHLGQPLAHIACSSNSIKFTDSVLHSHETVKFQLATTPGVRPTTINLYVISADFPVLVSVDTMDCNSVTPCNITDTLIKRNNSPNCVRRTTDKWKVPIARA